MPTLTHDSTVARAILAANRPLGAGEAQAHADRMARHVVLDLWYDPQHAFHPMGGCKVFRAIDEAGSFCWLVRLDGGRDSVSYAKSPYDAVPPASDHGPGEPQAAAALAEVVRGLRSGAIQIHLVAADFRGIGGPAEAIGRGGMPGWLAAWLFPLVPALGRAIWAAHRRTLECRRVSPRPVTRVPAGLPV